MSDPSGLPAEARSSPTPAREGCRSSLCGILDPLLSMSHLKDIHFRCMERRAELTLFFPAIFPLQVYITLERRQEAYSSDQGTV